MDAKIKADWLAALRSGKYGQVRRKLRFDNRFCCLGVLCDVVKPDGWDMQERHVSKAEHYPANEILEAVGVPPDMGDVHPFWALATMNDEGKSFAEIADHIEANL